MSNKIDTGSAELAEAIVTHQRRTATAAQVAAVKADTNTTRTSVLATATQLGLTDADVTTVLGIAQSTETKMDRMSGELIKTAGVALSGAGAQVENLFEFEGAVLIKELYLQLTDDTDTTTLSNVKFAIHDTTNTEDIVDVVDLSGFETGSIAGILGNVASNVVAAQADQCRVIQHATLSNPFYGCIINALKGVDNTIQLLYTGDADTDAEAVVYMRYVLLTDDATMAVA
jgi:hypothetical protein